jgi:hypothetical protein
MKLVKLHTDRRFERRGAALVIVLVMLSVMSALVVGNVTTLRRLKVELDRLEEKQNRFHRTRANELPAARTPAPTEPVSTPTE